jgi:hypothetical protein
MSNQEWGNATWILFHSLAQQITEKAFTTKRLLLIKFVRDTCYHLPCPICSEHASNLLSKSYTNKIQTKDDFIEFLRQFHNIVNHKLNKPILSELEVGEKYKRARLNLVIQNFLNTLSISYGNMKMLIHSFQRQQYIRSQKSFLNEILVQCNTPK